jgi:hypothetical protein
VADAKNTFQQATEKPFVNEENGHSMGSFIPVAICNILLYKS